MSKTEPTKPAAAAPKKDEPKAVEAKAPAVSPEPTKPAPVMKKVLRVVCGEANGFRRGGFRFAKGQTDLDLDGLTADQVAAIKAEPKLAAVEALVEVAQ
jgi:hypothetical protein